MSGKGCPCCGRAEVPDHLLRFITVEDAAEEFGVHQDSIRRAIRRGVLAAHKAGRGYRIRRVHWEAFLEMVRFKEGPA